MVGEISVEAKGRESVHHKFDTKIILDVNEAIEIEETVHGRAFVESFIEVKFNSTDK